MPHVSLLGLGIQIHTDIDIPVRYPKTHEGQPPIRRDALQDIFSAASNVEEPRIDRLKIDLALANQFS